MSSPFPKALVLLLLLGFCGITAWADPPMAMAAPRPEKLSFQSQGRRIAIDFFPAGGAGARRTIIVMPGAGGMLFDGPAMRRVARALAGAGDAVYLLHYFNRTGTIAEPRISQMERHFDEWLGTVRDAVVWVQARENKPAAKIGVYGYSLGAFLAVAAASDNPKIDAIAEQAGGMWNSQETRVGKMPPVLMIHGRADQRVPFDKYARPLERVLRERGGKVKTHFVDGEGHGFTPPAMAAVRTELVGYFDQELRP
jgi:dienelactone hydrolase